MERAAIGHIVLSICDPYDFSIYNAARQDIYKRATPHKQYEYAREPVLFACRIADQAILNAQEDSKNV